MSKRYQPTKMQTRLNTPIDERKPLGKPMKENTFWTDLTKTYNDTIENSNIMGREVLIALSNVSQHPEKQKYIKNEVALANCVDLMSKDITDHHAALKKINDAQLSQSGGTVDPDDHMLAISLHGEYSDQVSKFNSIFLDNVKVIEEMLNEAETDYFNATASKNKAASDLINPDVITDIEFKEVVNG